MSFEWASDVFKDPFALEFIDDRQDYGEQRFVIIGSVDEQILFVAYTERQDVIRVISTRKATKHEKKAYLQQDNG